MINSYINLAKNYFHSLHLGQFKELVNFKIESPGLLLGVGIIVILVLAFAIDRLLINSALQKSYRIFVAPGIVLHELSHALLCLLTGAKIKNISFFDKDGGSVEHEPSKIPLIGSVLISIALLASGVIAILFLSSWLGIKGNTNYIDDYLKIGVSLKALLLSIHLSDWKNWLILYLAVSIVVTMTPSKQDIMNMLAPVILIVALVGLKIYYKISFFSLSNSTVNHILIILSPIFLLLILAFLLSIIIFALSKLGKR